ncbi:MAG TPA: caspase family protein [Bryobacterales bacterium]|nr:caspase family protein [Bryobacterales bacterium]
MAVPRSSPRAVPVLGLLLFVCGLPIGRAQSPAVSTPTEKRVALVIGNDAYRHAPRLRNAVNDANDLGATLRELGFDSEVVLNADQRSMETAFDRFVARLSPGCVAFFHYSGHGLQVDQENFLIPTDYKITDEASVRYDASSASKLHDRVAASGVALNVIVLDACRNNGFRTARSAGAGLAAMNAARGSFIAFSTAPGQIASDNPRGRNGLFTSYFLEALKVPGLKLDDVFNRVREQVYQASNQKQLAWTSSSVIGDFRFNRSGKNRDLVFEADAGANPAPPAVEAGRQSQPQAPSANGGADEGAESDRYLKLSARANIVYDGLQKLRQEQAQIGASLRGDMAGAAERMKSYMDQADRALRDGNVSGAEQSMNSAEREVEKLEKFLGM